MAENEWYRNWPYGVILDDWAEQFWRAMFRVDSTMWTSLPVIPPRRLAGEALEDAANAE